MINWPCPCRSRYEKNDLPSAVHSDHEAIGSIGSICPFLPPTRSNEPHPLCKRFVAPRTGWNWNQRSSVLEQCTLRKARCLMPHKRLKASINFPTAGIGPETSVWAGTCCRLSTRCMKSLFNNSELKSAIPGVSYCSVRTNMNQEMCINVLLNLIMLEKKPSLLVNLTMLEKVTWNDWIFFLALTNFAKWLFPWEPMFPGQQLTQPINVSAQRATLSKFKMLVSGQQPICKIRSSFCLDPCPILPTSFGGNCANKQTIKPAKKQTSGQRQKHNFLVGGKDQQSYVVGFIRD